MEAAGLDMLWITNPANMNWLVGYDAWSFYVHQGVLVSLTRAEPLWIGRGIDVSAARITTTLGDDSIRGYGDEFITGRDHPMQFMARIITELGGARARIGVELDTHYFTARGRDVLAEGLPGATLVDADGLVNWLRSYKSPAEVAYLRQAAQITDIAMQRGIDAIAPGVRQCDVAGEIYQALIAGHPDFYGDVPDFQTMPKGPRTTAPHLTWTDEHFLAGETCTLELGANRFRYHAPLARTVHVGQPPDALRHLADVVEEGLEAALAAIRPGQPCEAVEAAWRSVLSRHGMSKASRIGYCVGIGYPPDWGERTASLAAGDKTLLAPDMVFHLMLGMWREGEGYELSETFAVTEGGCEVFSRLPRTLVVKHG